MLVMELLLLPSVSHKVFHHLPVHERFPAEEIHLQVPSASGIGNQEIKRLLSHFKAHHCTPAMILPFFCKAISAGKVTVMGNMETKRFHHRLALLHLADHALICIFYKQLPCLCKLCHVCQGILNIVLAVAYAKLLHQFF